MSATVTFASPQISLPTLVMNALGEYTARSVAADPLDAAGLHLVRQDDGAYATPTLDPFVVSTIPAGRSSVTVQSALQGLSLGG